MRSAEELDGGNASDAGSSNTNVQFSKPKLKIGGGRNARITHSNSVQGKPKDTQVTDFRESASEVGAKTTHVYGLNQKENTNPLGQPKRTMSQNMRN